ncbi:hypothetical protein BGZ59_002211, partial [Podila verticillata]
NHKFPWVILIHRTHLIYRHKRWRSAISQMQDSPQSITPLTSTDDQLTKKDLPKDLH